MGIGITVVAGSPDLLLAKKTVATSDCERYHNSVALTKIGHLFPHLFDNTHELVAQYSSRFHGRNKPVIEVQVRAADSSPCDLNDCVMRVQELGICYGEGLDFALSHPTDSLHKSSNFVT